MNPLIEFINNFNHNTPDWVNIPTGFPDCDMAGLISAEIGKFNSIVTLWELSQPKKPQSRSRAWKDPTGYRYLVPWSNAVLLRHLVRILTNNLPRSEYRRKAQLDDAARSSVRNIEEGFKRATTSEYIDFIGYSQGSLEEVKGDIRELTEDGFLKSKKESSFAGIGIDLGDFHKAFKETKGKYRKIKDFIGGPDEFIPLVDLYPPLKKISVNNFTYEIFLELINKTDWHFRRLVESLEKKMNDDRKGYKIEQERIKYKFKKK